MAVSGKLGREGDHVSGCKSSLCNLQMQAFLINFNFNV